MIRRIFKHVKLGIFSKERKNGGIPKSVAYSVRNDRAAEIAAHEVVVRYGDAMKSLSKK